MAMDAAYCPYDIAPLSALAGARAASNQTPFGALHWVAFGPLDNQPVTVMVHGVNDDGDTWYPLLCAARAAGADLGSVLVVDLPGFGLSRGAQPVLDLVSVGDALLNVATGLGAGALRLVGHSMGALLVADLALRHPSRIASVHLVAGPYYSVLDVLSRRAASREALVASAIYRAMYAMSLTGGPGMAVARFAVRHGLGPLAFQGLAAHPWSLPRSILEHFVSGMRPRSFRAAARNGRRYPNGLTLAGVAQPVWGVYGAADRLVPGADCARLLADVPTARVCVLRDAGHLPHIEQPGAALRALGLI